MLNSRKQLTAKTIQHKLHSPEPNGLNGFSLDLVELIGPEPVGGMEPQIIIDCGNFFLDLQQCGFWSSRLWNLNF